MRFRRLFSIQLSALLVVSLIWPWTGTSNAQSAHMPPMGWNSWNHFGTKVTDPDVRAQPTPSWQAVVYVNIDDSWEGERDADGNIHPNSRFPNMKALADYLHSRTEVRNLFFSGTEDMPGL